jgi:hypothetical protein
MTTPRGWRFPTHQPNPGARIPKTLEYFFDDCHFTDEGSHAVADVIAAVVQQQVDVLGE